MPLGVILKRPSPATLFKLSTVKTDAKDDLQKSYREKSKPQLTFSYH